jgi:4'-phosphopantetheinyl transferase
MDIYAVKVQPIPDELFWQLSSFLSLERQAKLPRFVRREDAYRSLIGETLLRKILMEHYRLRSHEIVFGRNRYGKPYLEGHERIHFNISHSGDWVVYAVDDQPVGIDVERVQSTEVEIAERFFSAEEYADLMAIPEEERMSFFYDLWTLKESFVKAVGEGLHIPLNSFTIKIDGGQVRLAAGDQYERWYFQRYGLDTLYKLAACARHPDFPDRVIKERMSVLARDFLQMNQTSAK